MSKRRSKTLLQQAKYYEVEGEYKEQEMMSYNGVSLHKW